MRALLRDYRHRAAEYISNLRGELGTTARALEEILNSLGQTKGDDDTRLGEAMKRLRDAAESPAGEAVRALVNSAVNAIEDSLEEMRKQHRLAISQFQVEIRMLHKRIDGLEAASSVSQLANLLGRREIEHRIRCCGQGCCLILVGVRGFRAAEAQFDGDMAAQLAAAFAKRLRNSVPPEAALGRWSNEEFIRDPPGGETGCPLHRKIGVATFGG